VDRFHAVQLAVEAQVLLRGKVGVEGGLLEDQPDVAAYLVALRTYVETGDLGRPLGRFDQSTEDLDGGGLAGTVGSEKAEGLARQYVEVDPRTAWTSL